MSKRLYKYAQDLVKSQEGVFKLNKSLREICSEVGVGVDLGSKIKLSTADLFKIKKHYSEILGQDLIKVNFDNNSRIEAASALLDEKWAKKGVFSDLLNFASNGDLLALKRACVEIPKGTLLSTTLENLNLKAIKRLIIVENGEILKHADILDNLLPEIFKESLILYRGHGENIKNVQRLLDLLDKDITLGFFGDLDAAGLFIAQTLREHFKGEAYLLLPESIDDLIKVSKYESYIKQLNFLDKLLSCENECEITKEYAKILERFNLAIMQEHMLAKGISLQAHKFK